MKSFVKFVAELVAVFLIVNILQDIAFYIVDTIRAPYVEQLEEVERELEQIQVLLEDHPSHWLAISWLIGGKSFISLTR